MKICFSIVEFSIGKLFLATTPIGICRISFDSNLENNIAELANTFKGEIVEKKEPLGKLSSELNEYFHGKRKLFNVNLDLGSQTDFTRNVLYALSAVSYGEIATYKEIAIQAGFPKGARAVGRVMNQNPVPIVLPCHRIVGSNRKLTGYRGGTKLKQALLALEEVSF